MLEKSDNTLNYVFHNPEGTHSFQSSGHAFQTTDWSEVLKKLNTSNHCFVESPFEKSDLTFTFFNESFPFQSETKMNSVVSYFQKTIPSHEQYQHLFSKAQLALRDELEKIVMARKNIFEFKEKQDPMSIACSLLASGKNTYKILKSYSPNEIFFSKTPEMLLKWSAGRIETVAIAGTQKKQLSPERLLESSKDQYEHQIVVQSIIQKLDELGIKAEAQEQTLLEQNNLVHLRTPIVANEVKWDLLPAIIKMLHPTPAVLGEPKEKSREWLLQNENLIRGQYAGLFGILSREYCEIAVTIRSGYIYENEMEVFTGSGIVSESECDEEWEELTLKLDSILGNTLEIERKT